MRRSERSPASEIAPPGWYPHPENPEEDWYWDGAAWTESLGWYPHPERPEEEWYWDGTDWTESRWAKPSRKRRAPRSPAELLRVRFRVAFDGDWKEDFDTLAEATEWAQEVATTGRTVWVVEQRPFSVDLRAVLPAEHADAARREWERVHDWRSVIAAFGKGFG